MSKEIFKQFFKHTLRWEGGSKLHNVKGDSGGWTKYGIAYNKNKHLFDSLKHFKKIDYEQASTIAYEKYYLPIKTDKLPFNAQLMYFDMAYNMGNNRAIKILQDCLGLKKDGIIGRITESKMHLVTLDCLYKKRNDWYKLLDNRTSWGSKFYKGWINRSEDIYLKSKENEKQNTNNSNNIISNSNNSTVVSKNQKSKSIVPSTTGAEATSIEDRFINNIEKWSSQKDGSRYPKRKGDY